MTINFLKRYSWTFGQDVKWLQTITNLPILVKGVLTAEDSKQNSILLPSATPKIETEASFFLRFSYASFTIL